AVLDTLRGYGLGKGRRVHHAVQAQSRNADQAALVGEPRRPADKVPAITDRIKVSQLHSDLLSGIVQGMGYRSLRETVSLVLNGSVLRFGSGAASADTPRHRTYTARRAGPTRRPFRLPRCRNGTRSSASLAELAFQPEAWGTPASRESTS